MGTTPSCHQNLRLERDPRKQANDVISISAAESFDALNTANKRNDVPDISKGLARIRQRLLGHQLIFTPHMKHFWILTTSTQLRASEDNVTAISLEWLLIAPCAYLGGLILIMQNSTHD